MPVHLQLLKNAIEHVPNSARHVLHASALSEGLSPCYVITAICAYQPPRRIACLHI